MHDQQEKIIEELKTALLALPTEDKKSILTALDAPGATVPENCQPYITAINELAEIADVAIFREALTMPQQIEIQEPGEDVISKTLQLLRDIPQEEKDKLRLGLVDSDQIEHFSDVSRLYWLWIMTVIKSDPEKLQDITEIFGVSLQEIQWLLVSLIGEGTAVLSVDDEESYLPGMAPQKILPPVSYIKSLKFELPTARAAREISYTPFVQNSDNTAICAEFVVKKSKREDTTVKIAFWDKTGVTYPITSEDKNIMIAMGNLYNLRQTQVNGRGWVGGSVIAAEDIIRWIKGLDNRENIRPETIKHIEQRIEYLKELKITCDFTAHCAMSGVSEEDSLAKGQYTANFIEANTIQKMRKSGKVEMAWEVLREPLIFSYAKKIGQFATLDSRLLDVQEAHSSTDTETIKTYLLEKIVAMINPRTHRPKKGHKATRFINFRDMFQRLNIVCTTRTKKKRKIETVKKILENCKTTPDKTRGCFIKGYEFKKDGLEIVGVEIEF